MKNIIEDLYFGEIPASTMHEINNELLNKSEKIEKALLEILDDDEKRIINTYIDCQARLNAEIALDGFKKGFNIAFQFARSLSD